jgi:PKD repeat protein
MRSQTGHRQENRRFFRVTARNLLARVVLVSIFLLLSVQIYGHETRGLPNASFTYSPIDPLVNQTVMFAINGTVSLGTSYSWDFGNGTTLTTTAVTVVGRYTTAGTYTVTLTVSDPKSTDMLSRSVTVFTSVPLTASFSVNPPEPVALTSAKFDATSSSDPNGTIISYVWNYGDGSKNTTTSPITFHQYPSVGSFNATLTLIDSNGSNSSSLVPVFVLAKVTVTVSGSPAQGSAPLTVSLSALAAGGQGSYTFAWTFGDGESGFGQSVSHNYTTAGTYQVQVLVSDSAAPVPHVAFGSAVVTVTGGVRLDAGPIPISYLVNGIGIAVLGTAVLLLVYGITIRRAHRRKSAGSGFDPYSKKRSFPSSRIRHGYDLDMKQNMNGVVQR